MKFLNVVCTVILIIFLVGGASAQSLTSQTISKTGTAAAQVLKIAPSARSIAMGGAFVAVANDISTLYWNPSGLSRIYANEVTFTHINWLVETNYDFIAVGINLHDAGSIGLMLSTFSSGEMPVLTIQEPNGTGEFFDTRDFMIGVSYARNLTENFSLGATIKYISQRIWHMDASTIAFDIGTLFTTPFWGIRLGASISNFGSKMQLDGRDIRFATDPDQTNYGNVEFVNALYEMKPYDLPLSFQVGLAKILQISESNQLVFALDAVHPSDNFEFVNTGVEYGWKEMVFLRAGYKSLFLKDSEEGLTLGGGLKIRLAGTMFLLADYAYADFGRLENAQRFTLSVRF